MDELKNKEEINGFLSNLKDDEFSKFLLNLKEKLELLTNKTNEIIEVLNQNKIRKKEEIDFIIEDYDEGLDEEDEE